MLYNASYGDERSYLSLDADNLLVFFMCWLVERVRQIQELLEEFIQALNKEKP